ncbi:MAG: threonine 3-dehydrogenase [Colwellia sp.]|jgi:threonine 3-dehydrogenase|tara:strand:+ start:10909 stop:11103 length:195 start_codon:yes stop_codon:yes gene_type:complete
MLDNMNNGGKITILDILDKEMASLIQSGLDISPIITHQYNIDDFQQGFDVIGLGQSGKVILNWE